MIFASNRFENDHRRRLGGAESRSESRALYGLGCGAIRISRPYPLWISRRARSTAPYLVALVGSEGTHTDCLRSH